MLNHGFMANDVVVDIGAGRMEFAKRLQERVNWNPMCYVPVDGSIDGTDIETWEPGFADWFVAVELLEHLEDPARLINLLPSRARKGIVATTPNPFEIDVLAIDRTHKTPLYPDDFNSAGYNTRIASFFAKPNDSIIAWRKTC